MIAAAVGSSPVRYRFDAGSDKKTLKGEGQLEFIDRGASRKNYEEWMDNEARGLKPERYLYDQIVKDPGRHETRQSLHGAMDVALSFHNDFYLLFDKADLHISKFHGFRQYLGERFPSIQQIISHKDADASAGDYYLDGLNSGGIDQQIYEIYSRIHELSQ